VDHNLEHLPFLLFVCEGEPPVIGASTLLLRNLLGYGDSPIAGLPAQAVLDFPDTRMLNSHADQPVPQYINQPALLIARNSTKVPVYIHVTQVSPRRWAFVCCQTSMTGIPVQDGERVWDTGRNSSVDALRIVSDGMNHEINNPLQGILGSLELALKINKDPEVKEYLKFAIGEADRVKEAVLSLRFLVAPERDSADS